MAKKQILSITLPDGTVGTRQTARPYTHVIVARIDQAVQATVAAEWVTTCTEWVPLGYRTEADLAEAKAKLAEIDPEGIVWTAWSWHGSHALAAKALDNVRAFSHVAEAHIQEV